MVKNLKCDECDFQSKCVARNKLKPFLDTARTDLGVTLNFEECIDFVSSDNGEDKAQ